MEQFSIQRQWLSALNEPPEIAQTSAMLKIVLGNEVVTRNEDEWAQTVRDDVRLSAYPLALWFASSWWRLRWEPFPVSEPSLSWRMSHEVAAAGHGYVWPRMLFASDGESVRIWSAQSRSESTAPVHYLTTTFADIEAGLFERVIDDFVFGVIARLDAVNVGRTTLHDLWQEILQERREKKVASERRVEAMLGFDPDEGPEVLLVKLKELMSEAGTSAVAEIAALCASRDPAESLNGVLSFARSEGLHGRILLDRRLSDASTPDAMPAWQRGWELARRVRSSMGLNGSPVSDNRLCEMVDIPSRDALDVHGKRGAPLGVAIRDDGSTAFKFLFRKRNLPGRRFELARFLCDHLIADAADRWLPVTDEKTSRQKTQRAFAAEFLCPIHSLQDFLGGDFSGDKIDDAAEYFGVASRAVETQLVNHRLLPPAVLSDYDGAFPLFTRAY